MKKFFALVAGLIAAVSVSAQIITFERTEHDFGKINEADGRVTTIFTFKNEGMDPLVLSNVRASCGCTTPKWTKEPIEPGQNGEITVTYNPSGRPGHFQKTITVSSNSKEASTSKLYIKGEVIPKAVKPVDMYPVKMGKLSLKENSIDFGNVLKDSLVYHELGIANQTDSAIFIYVVSPDYIDARASKESKETEYAAKRAGLLYVQMETKSLPYGPMEAKLYLLINGSNVLDETKSISIKANVVEDFSRLTEEELKNAPIVDVNSRVELGKIVRGKRTKLSFGIANVGMRNLMVHRLIANTSQMRVSTASTIKSGKKGAIKVEVKDMEPGDYTSQMTIITNDPKNSQRVITLHWTVE